MSNAAFQTVTLAIFLLYAGALALAFLPRRRIAPLLWANLAAATAVLAYMLLNRSTVPADMGVAALVELAAIVLAVFSRRGVRPATWLSCLIFAVHMAMAALMMLFAFTFHMTRLI